MKHPDLYDIPFWWVESPFGTLVFVLAFITWGLVIVWLSMSILLMLRKLTQKKGKGKKGKFLPW